MHKWQTKGRTGTLFDMTMCALVSNLNAALLEGFLELLDEQYCFN